MHACMHACINTFIHSYMRILVLLIYDFERPKSLERNDGQAGRRLPGRSWRREGRQGSWGRWGWRRNRPCQAGPVICGRSWGFNGDISWIFHEQLWLVVSYTIGVPPYFILLKMDFPGFPIFLTIQLLGYPHLWKPPYDVWVCIKIRNSHGWSWLSCYETARGQAGMSHFETKPYIEQPYQGDTSVKSCAWSSICQSSAKLVCVCVCVFFFRVNFRAPALRISGHGHFKHKRLCRSISVRFCFLWTGDDDDDDDDDDDEEIVRHFCKRPQDFETKDICNYIVWIQHFAIVLNPTSTPKKCFLTQNFEEQEPNQNDVFLSQLPILVILWLVFPVVNPASGETWKSSIKVCFP